MSKDIAHTNSYRIADLSQLDLRWLKDVETVAVTAGASTPTPIVKEVINFLKDYDPMNSETHVTASNVPVEKILPKIKKLSRLKLWNKSRLIE